ncbi:MAG: YcxB family protein [Chitinophagaceae bacterium]|nr:YcxB family protein [Chitinophagaceae bacterium]
MEWHYKYTLTKEEYLEFNLFSCWTAPWRKSARIKYFVTYFILCFSVSVFVVATSSKSNSFLQFLPFSLIISLIIAYLSSLHVKLSIKRKILTMLSKEEINHLLQETELTINEDKIIDKTQKSTSIYTWDSIVRYAKTEDKYCLYVNALNAIIIPGRLFNNQSEADDFEKFILSKIPHSSSFRSSGI